MRPRSSRPVSVFIVGMLLAAVCAVAIAKDAPPKSAQKANKKAAAEEPDRAAKEAVKPPAPLPAPKGRLPAHFTKVVTHQQRLQIYLIQAEYDPQIRELRDQLDALLDQRDAKIDAVLTPEQRKQIADLKAAAKEKRKKAKEQQNAPSEPAKE
jgi:hypothetical protein